MQEIDIGRDIPISDLNFMLSTSLWDSFDSDILSIISAPQKWVEVKLLTADGNKNPQLATLPADKGGIYLFLAKSHILPESLLYIMYIGRAHITAAQNLRKRCSEYPTEKKRPKIVRMIKQWGQYLYIRYLPLEDNEKIDEIEAELINKILPPFNEAIPNQEIRGLVKAWRI